MKVAIIVLTVLFWLALSAVVVWTAVYAYDNSIILDRFGEKQSRLVRTVLLGALALTSGLLVAYYRLTNTFIDRDAYWTTAEVSYALVLFMALFFGLYSFLGWYFAD